MPPETLWKIKISIVNVSDMLQIIAAASTDRTDQLTTNLFRWKMLLKKRSKLSSYWTKRIDEKKEWKIGGLNRPAEEESRAGQVQK